TWSPRRPIGRSRMRTARLRVMTSLSFPYVEVAASQGTGGGLLLPVFVGVGVQVERLRLLSGVEILHPIQREFSVIPGGPAAVGECRHVPVNVALGNNRLGRFYKGFVTLKT